MYIERGIYIYRERDMQLYIHTKTYMGRGPFGLVNGLGVAAEDFHHRLPGSFWGKRASSDGSSK